MKVLSLFDGMACGMLAMQKAGIEVERYVAYEIDKYAVQTSSHNFPVIEHRGDVFEADFTEFAGFDFLLGGSPCTYWSIAQTNNRETEASGMGWELFSQYVRALHEARPKFFVYENNKSMSKAIRASIDEAFGFEAICINSALVSAQNRQRLYWVGKRNEDGTYSKVDIEQPKDLGVLLKDVLDGNPCNPSDTGKARTIHVYSENNNKQQHDYVANPVLVGEAPGHNGNYRNGKQACQQYRCYSTDGKSVSLCGNGGGGGAKTGLYAIPVECKTIERAIPEIAEKYGYIPEMFNAYNRAEITDKAPTLSTGSMVTSSCAVNRFECLRGFAAPCEWDESGKPFKAISGGDGKTYDVYEVKDGYITIKGKRYAIKLADGFYIIRKLTVRECMRLQTVPEWYEFPVSDAQAYKMLGNGWTVDVIAHLLRGVQSSRRCGSVDPTRPTAKRVSVRKVVSKRWTLPTLSAPAERTR